MLERLLNLILLGPDDGIPDLGGFESDDGDMAEFIELGPGEELPGEEDEAEDEDDDKVTLSKAELEALKNTKGSGDSSMLEGLISGLKEAIQPGQGPQVEQQAGESDEDFNKRIVEELFDRDGGGAALQSAIERYTGKEKAQLLGIMSEQNKQLLELNPKTSPMFEKYGKEIEKKVKELPANQQLHPNAWKWALDQVKLAHADDIQQDSVDKLVQEKVNAALRARGIDPDEDEAELELEKAPKKKKAAVGSGLGSGRGSANVRNGKKSGKRAVYYTKEDARIAKEKMIPLDVYLRHIGKM